MDKIKNGLKKVFGPVGRVFKAAGKKIMTVLSPIGRFFKKIGMRAYELKQKYMSNILVFNAFLSVVLYVYMEIFARQSLIAFGKFVIESPLVFLLNVIIIFATYSIPILFPRRTFWHLIVTAFWFAIGTINGIVLLNRLTPFNVKDLANIEEAKAIATNYLSVPLLIIVAIVAVAIIAGLVVLFVKGPKVENYNWKKSIASFFIIVMAMLCIWTGAVKMNVVSTYFGNLPYAYRDYGIPYSFISTWVITGIGEPDNYSEEYIQEGIFVNGELGDDGIFTPEITDEDTEHPNILFLQLESFFDPTLFKNFEYNQDPMPYYRQLMGEYSSGMLTVPSVGAGTANVEFEAMTGISVRFFGPGEYPYKSVLKEETVEGIPYDLKNMGYSTHAIHNHRGAFYGRNEVFKNMGFDTFTSLEYMINVEKTKKNWAKDNILIDNIVAAMDSTEGHDYIYTISVQGHGKYPEEETLTNPPIKITSAPADFEEEVVWQYEYYVNQIYEMDQFVKDLTDTLAEYDEDVILVMYGDHLPALEVYEEHIVTGDMYMTQYIIWDNFGMEKEDANLTCYEIGSEVLDRLGIHTGLITTYQQKYKGTSNYLENLEALAYDMLYGEKYIYGGTSPFAPTNMRMGINPIKIEEIVQIGENYYIKGQNFTEYSKVSLDGEPLKTIYLGPTLLGLKEEVDPEDVVNMKISQVEKNDVILSTTE